MVEPSVRHVDEGGWVPGVAMPSQQNSLLSRLRPRFLLAWGAVRWVKFNRIRPDFEWQLFITLICIFIKFKYTSNDEKYIKKDIAMMKMYFIWIYTYLQIIYHASCSIYPHGHIGQLLCAAFLHPLAADIAVLHMCGVVTIIFIFNIFKK